jgi:hypothetical protein
MRRILPAVVLLFATVAIAQTKPASQPATLPVINCPDVESLIANIPANLIPAKPLEGQEYVDHVKAVNDWSDAKVKGITIDFSILAPLAHDATAPAGTYKPTNYRVSYMSATHPEIKMDVLIRGEHGGLDYAKGKVVSVGFARMIGSERGRLFVQVVIEKP